MTRLKYIGAAIVLLCFGLTTAAQNISNKGKEFWVAYGHHQYMETDNSQDMTIYLSTEAQSATVTVTIDSSSALPTVTTTWWRRTYVIPPYTVINLATATASSYTTSAGASGAIPKTGSQDARLLTPPPPSGSGGEGLFRKRGIHIESDVPIVAYAHIYASVSSGATMLLPVESWGYSYTTINSEQVDAGGPAFSWVYVIAKEDNTKVMITPAVDTRPGKPAGTPFEVTLMKGQVYQIIGQSNGSGTGNQFTGTTVKSVLGSDGTCKPIAVFAGSSRTRGESDPCGTGSGRDNDMQQCYPESAWGKRYLTAPFGTGTGSTANPNVVQTSVFKIVVRDPNTTIKRNGVTIPKSSMLTPNYYKFSTNAAEYIEADQPIMIGQFMSGSATCNPGGQGDPEMVFLSPIEQAIKNVVFFRNDKTSIGVNLLTLIIPTAGLSSLVITDHTGNAGVSNTFPHPGLPGYSVHIRGWAATPGQTRVKSDSAFNIIAYGLGGAESYAYSGGANVNNLNYLNGLHNIPDTTGGGKNFNEFTGINTPTKFGILLRYIPTKLTFKFSAWPTTPAPGIVTVLSDGVAPDVTAGVDFVMSPVTNYFVDSPVINGVKYYWYQLPDSFRFNIAGTHTLPVVAESPGIDNCGNKENMSLTFTVVPQPTSNFSITHPTKCTKDSIILNGPATAVSAATSYNLNQWYWTVSQGATVIRRDSVKTPSIYLQPGTYTVTLNAVTIHGLLVSPISQNITVYDKPSVTFNASPDTLCLGQSVTFSQTSSYSGPVSINSYKWDLGDGTTGTAGAWANINKTYAATGTYYTNLIVGVSAACVDTARKTVVVVNKTHANITPPSGCLTGGVGQFQASSTAQGGNPITSYSWNFGDPSTGSNNTSTLQNPSHTFSAPGVYQVILTFTTASGCPGADTLSVNANIKPTLAFTSLAAVCQNANPVSVANASVTNGLSGTGYYYDASGATTSAGMFNPATAGAGTHRIWYVFTTTTNCKDSIYQDIIVSARPAKPVVTTPVTYCEGATASALTATALPAHTLTWYTVPTLTGGSSTAPTPSTATAGSTKYYVTQTKDGCEGEADTITVVVNPLANGTLAAVDADICVNEDGKIEFTSTGGTSPFSITYTIKDPSNISTPVTQNNVTSGTQFIVIPSGSAAGTYTITFNSITNSNGCIRSTGLSAAFNIVVTALPVVTINPVAPICEGTSATLTASGATTYVWNPGNIAGNGITVSPASTQSYSVEGTTNGCKGTANISVVVNPRPAKPTVTSPVTYCQDGTATALSATAASGNTLTWYNNASLTGGSSTAPTPSTATAGTTTYYVTQTNSGNCESAAETITVTVVPSVSANTVLSNQTICSGSTPAVTGSIPSGGTGVYSYQWQSSPDGSAWSDIAGATNIDLATTPLTTTTHYRRIVNSGLCSNTSAAIIVTVTPALGNNTIGTSHNVCEGLQPNQLTGSTPTGGNGSLSYQWQSAASSSGPWSNIATNGTGKDYLPPILSVTTYYRRIVSSNPCSDTSATIVTVTVTPNANGNITANDADICQYEDGKIRFNLTTGTAPVSITYTIKDPSNVSTPVTKTGVSNNDEFIVVPNGSAAGAYTITLNSITNSNGCVNNGPFNTVTITVTQTPVVSIAPVSPVCIGSTVTLNASGATDYTWNSASASAPLSATTGASVTTTPTAANTYNITVQGSTNGCTGNTANASVVVNPKPTAPTVTSPVEYCQLGTASPLTGTGDPGNTVKWYDNAALTNGVTTAPTPSTTNAGATTYYVTQTNGFGCESTPATITVNITSGLGGNSIGAEQTICQGNTPAPLTNGGTLSGGSGTYNYQWQVSTDGINWTNIAGATSADYSPGVLNDTTWYRRNVTSSLCGSVSNVVRINVFEGLGNYNITGTYPAICENTAPIQLNGQAPTGSGTFTFTWEQSTDGVNWTAIAGSNTEDYQPPVLTDTMYYRRKVTNGPCTATSNEIRIDVNMVANGNISAPSAICVYDAASITFNATVGTGTFTIEYNITAPGGGVTPSGPVNVTNGSVLNVIPANSPAGTYTIALTSVQSSNGCVRTTGLNSVSITVNPRPVVTIDPVTAICEGESKTITANNATSYAWNPGSLTGASISVTPAVTTTYTVVGTALGCQSNPVSVVLTVNAKPDASFTIADNNICLKETAFFTNTSTVDSGSITDLYWDFDNGNLQTTPYTTTPISQTYATHRVYNVKLTAKSDKGCTSDVFTLPITVNPMPVASFTNPSFVCMPNGVATFTNTSTIPAGNITTYAWTFGDAGSGAANFATSQHGSHVYPDSASYDIKLLVISAEGCRDSVTQSFNTFFNKPVAKFGVTPDTLCQGIQNAFFDSSYAPGSTINTRLWTFGDGSTSTDAAPTKTYLLPGNYDVNLRVANAQGCSADFNKSVVVYLQPVVDAGQSFIVPQGTAIVLNGQTNSGTLSLAWSSPTYASINNASILKPTYIADNDAIFILTATGEGNCSATDTLTVKVLRPIVIPNAFSPNGDGINDTWGITNLGDYPNAMVEVFNRHGQSVYKQYGYGKPWDGKMNGRDLPIGTYYYIIDPKSGSQKITGYVVIVR